MARKGPAARVSRVHTSHSKLEFVDIASLRVARIRAPERGVLFELARAGSARGGINFVLQISGTSLCTQQRRSSHLAPGQWDAFEIGALHVTPDQSPSEQVALLMPLDQLDRKVNVTQLASRRQPGASGVSRLLCHAGSVLFQEIPKSSDARLAELAEPLCRWLNIAVRERIEGSQVDGSPRERLMHQAKLYVNAHLRDPTLSVDRIAGHLRCTTRYLQQAYQSTGRHLRDQIRDMRLDRCYCDLLDPAQAERSITEIALSWGFNSVTHFSDAFHRHFGVSPSAARRDRAS